jgi:hypothetical protein
MSDNKQNSKQYSAADIQRYLKGQMSAEEMHAIETAALDDPFLADAIEGFETVMAEKDEEAINAGLGKLNKQFSERIKQPGKVVYLNQSKWWRLSAAAMILLIVGVAVYNNWSNIDQKTNSQLAVSEKQQMDSSRLPGEQEERSSSSQTFLDTQKNQDNKSVTQVPAPAEMEKASSRFTTKKDNETNNRSTKKKNGNTVEKEMDKRDDLVSTNIDRSEKAKEEVSNKPAADQPIREREMKAAGPESLGRRNNQSSEQLKNFSGRVVDPSNKPLPYANVQIMQNRASLMTDEKGHFNFTTKDSIVDVQVGLIGFEQRYFRLQNDVASNNLVLEPSNQTLDEVVITGYGTQRKKDVSKTTVKVQNAVPEAGWIEYEKYLEKNKTPPAANPLMKGEVVVSFQVKRPAILSDFKIEKSLSKDYDKEAIRLIQEGPAWKLLNVSKARITVIVKF